MSTDPILMSDEPDPDILYEVTRVADGAILNESFDESEAWNMAESLRQQSDESFTVIPRPV